MAVWPFSKRKDDAADAQSADAPATSSTHSLPGELGQDPDLHTGLNQGPAQETTEGVAVFSTPHDPVDGEIGPFDGDVVNIETFDFSDFSLGLLDLGSMKIPLPKESQVQVEMGPEGPKMLHIVTRVGRVTPVAFAAPRNGGQWVGAAQDLIKGMEGDGLRTRVEEGPWGTEIVGANDNGVIRIIGIEGPRWMLRMTLAAPAGMEDDLAALGREIASRTFVYRGEAPILAGNSLPVVMPAALVEQVTQAMEERKAQEQAQREAAQLSDTTRAAAAETMDAVHEQPDSEQRN
ncbi:DUF3710 domain-containing protein [Corynebacterium lizhenjunii]|uniref:DUF3710 domain-containing protein n=1 Tax=Corynebacterium lizhenjunii TaxID=2709394 RepID=A0A7T0KD31_9CORY|nr:DUF3710 domain-containing protein [Corynebacterium lizhenjunii]QPK78322.1 DUF3710 domain-containing protein [Corynebacterium lizhenjunii]